MLSFTVSTCANWIGMLNVQITLLAQLKKLWTVFRSGYWSAVVKAHTCWAAQRCWTSAPCCTPPGAVGCWILWQAGLWRCWHSSGSLVENPVGMPPGSMLTSGSLCVIPSGGRSSLLLPSEVMSQTALCQTLAFWVLLELLPASCWSRVLLAASWCIPLWWAWSTMLTSCCQHCAGGTHPGSCWSDWRWRCWPLLPWWRCPCLTTLLPAWPGNFVDLRTVSCWPKVLRPFLRSWCLLPLSLVWVLVPAWLRATVLAQQILFKHIESCTSCWEFIFIMLATMLRTKSKQKNLEILHVEFLMKKLTKRNKGCVDNSMALFGRVCLCVRARCSHRVHVAVANCALVKLFVLLLPRSVVRVVGVEPHTL